MTEPNGPCEEMRCPDDCIEDCEYCESWFGLGGGDDDREEEE